MVHGTRIARRFGRGGWTTLLLLGLSGCDGPHPESEPIPDVHRSLAVVLDSAFREVRGVPGAVLRVEGTDDSFVWDGALGTVDRGTGAPLRTEHVLRIASVTKTFVAAAVLRLEEEGHIGIEDPVARHLNPATADLLREGGYDPSAITVRMALQHTSGLADYATAPAFVERILSDPTHRWTREEQLRLAMGLGGPVGAPGARFHYSDTGYILLGEILERVTGSPLHAALKRLLGFEALGLTATWMESVEAPPAGVPERAHQYLDSLDTYAFDPSFDLFGGGGLVSNLRDVSTFFRALFEGRVFRRPGTLDRMIVATPESVLSQGGAEYGLGVAMVEYGGHECFGHGGFWGVLVRYCPAADVLVAGAVTSTAGTAALDRLVRQALMLTLSRHRP